MFSPYGIFTMEHAKGLLARIKKIRFDDVAGANELRVHLFRQILREALFREGEEETKELIRVALNENTVPYGG